MKLFMNNLFGILPDTQEVGSEPMICTHTLHEGMVLEHLDVDLKEGLQTRGKMTWSNRKERGIRELRY